jgi:hypothetical protein
MEVFVYEDSAPLLLVEDLSSAPEKEIFHAIAKAFDTKIVTEDQPECWGYWGFLTPEE